ncbi:GerMN domain-containing protein [Candidatus Falkowbacteria bacterium]|nr:GerMN domain-containing protein [Candidatus Falkowbacteria bacterium]
MTTKKVIVIVILAVILITGLTIAVLRFSTPEDTWLCQNGEWIKHGNPSAPQPSTPCPGGKPNVNQPLTNENININQEPQNQVNIIVDKPKINEEITSGYIIEGQAAGWYFEASFPIKLLDEAGKEITTIIAQAQSDWMTSDFVAFKATLNFSIDKDQNGILVFMKDNPSGLPENDQKYEMPIKLKAELMNIKIFFGNSIKNPNTMDCSLVYPVERKVPKTITTATAAINELLKGLTEEEKSVNYYTSINPGVRLQKVTIKDGTAYADFDEQLEFQVGGSCRVTNIRSQITQTLKQFSSIKNVVISINGRAEDILQP